MANLETKYLGITLKNPIIVSSSGLTNSAEKIGKLVDAGVGAVVLKSLFEEQINHEINSAIYKGEGFDYPEAADYVKGYTRDNSVGDYLKVIKETKAKYDIPVIASINCFSSNEWVDFAQQIQEAGADAIELNVFVLNTDKNSDPQVYEQLYVDVVESVSKVVSIPVSIKLGSYFSNLVNVVNRLSVSGAKGVVLFNRFYEPDIDIEKMTLTSAEVLSTAADMRRTLRWVAITSDKIKNIDISASTGVHDGAAVVKQLLAGATSVQTCSAVYKNGPSVITKMLSDVEQWMDAKGFGSIEEFRGKMSYGNIDSPAVYERAQFMKYFSSYE
ncbi:dihydroorotate dehydrogenase-like protein [Carboxylicivirga sp. M1479]|uniref:dihydroorotate dehydrogenase-like protein n=1 Tax=Carboxylicivirga sp. M1479 TaxID=2594476 RepID=UPI0011775A54|nr:dihydroorotate dehydrogenase-like protein [Carboxylicivirga sp. M1479]TRX70653.1 dihydroorotate dehydrogenase-like protein [Carboxylicivirga sp. M1479]